MALPGIKNTATLTTDLINDPGKSVYSKRRLFVSGVAFLALLCLSPSRAAESQNDEERIRTLETKAAAGSDEARLELSEYLLQKSKHPLDTRCLGHWLRRMAGEGRDEAAEQTIDAFILLGKMRNKLRLEYPEVTEQMVQDANGVLGEVVQRAGGDPERVIEAALRDSWLLSMSSGMLETYYETHVEGYKRYDPRILDFYRVTSGEGIPRSMMFMGKILLNGWGVKQDVVEGKRLLENSGHGDEPYMALARHAVSQGDHKAAEEYLMKAAEYDNTDAIYELAIYAQGRQEYRYSFAYLGFILEHNPSDWHAKLEYARHLIQGWGVAMDEEKGFMLMKEVADDPKADQGGAACLNIAYFYALGIGVAESDELAQVYVKKAIEKGYEEAEEVFASVTE